MKTKVKIWAITADIPNSELDTELYGSIEQVREQQKLIIQENLTDDYSCQPKSGVDCDKLRALIAENKIEEAWEFFMEYDETHSEHRTHPRDCDSYWHVMEHTVEVDIPEAPETEERRLSDCCQAEYIVVDNRRSPNGPVTGTFHRCTKCNKVCNGT